MKGRKVHLKDHSDVRLMEPGDYGFDPKGQFWIVPPTGKKEFAAILHTGKESSQNWSVKEEADGTMSATPSIWYMKGQGKEFGEWHGYLIHGNWNEC